MDGAIGSRTWHWGTVEQTGFGRSQPNLLEPPTGKTKSTSRITEPSIKETSKSQSEIVTRRG